MIDEFDFGLYYSLIEDERFRDHYFENNDDFYTQFLFHEELTEYKSIKVEFSKTTDIRVALIKSIFKAEFDKTHYQINNIIAKNNSMEFNLKITWEGEEYIFERIENSKIFKRKYSDSE